MPSQLSDEQHHGGKEIKYLTFSLAGEEYGLSDLTLKEIIGPLPITPLPEVPRSIKGVINLRDKIILVIDLPLCLGLPAMENAERARVIVVELGRPDDRIRIGLLVNSISEILKTRFGDVEEVPPLESVLDADYISGLAEMDKGVRIVLDMTRVLITEGDQPGDPDSPDSVERPE